MPDIKFLVRLIIELERCSFFSFVALDELKMMKKLPDAHHKSRVGRVTGTKPFILLGLIGIWMVLPVFKPGRGVSQIKKKMGRAIFISQNTEITIYK